MLPTANVGALARAAKISPRPAFHVSVHISSEKHAKRVTDLLKRQCVHGSACEAVWEMSDEVRRGHQVDDLADRVAQIDAKHPRASYCARPGCSRQCTFRESGRGGQPRFCSARCRLKTHRERHELDDDLATLEVAVRHLREQPESRATVDALARAERARRHLEWLLQQYPQGRPGDSRRGQPRQEPWEDEQHEDDGDDVEMWVVDDPVQGPRLPLGTILARMSGEPLNLTQLGQVEALNILRRREELTRARWQRSPTLPEAFSWSPGNAPANWRPALPDPD